LEKQSKPLNKKSVIIKSINTMIYILNKYGKPLMPTTNEGYIRKLLHRGDAVVV